eukprot:315888-Hanusia_phi.AAC.1
MLAGFGAWEHGAMSGAYTLWRVLGRLHPVFLLQESRGQLVDAFWGSQDLGEPDIDPFTGRPYESHPTTGQPFDPDVHKRHPWDIYCRPEEERYLGGNYTWFKELVGYETVEEKKFKVEPERSAHGQLAYEHFTKALASINQLEEGTVFPVRVKYEKDNRQLHFEPLETLEEGNAKTDKGFARYLLHRHRGTVTEKGATPSDSTYSNHEGLKHSYRTIRAGTLNLLSRKIPPWRTESEYFNNCVSIVFLVYTLFFQIRGCALMLRSQAKWWQFTSPPMPGISEDEAQNASLRICAILVLKEIYPLTYYAFWLLAFLVLIVLSLTLVVLSFLLVWPLCWIFERYLGGDSQRRAHNLLVLKALGRQLQKDPLKVFLHRSFAQQIQIFSLMALNLSSLYRIKELVISNNFRRQIKPSIRDSDNKLTTVSNILFNMILLSIGPENSGNLLVSAITSLAILFYQMVCEKQRNSDLSESLRDVNENRLSKFELALLICKMIDDVTLEEVQFNFLEHFYSNPNDKPR